MNTDTTKSGNQTWTGLQGNLERYIEAHPGADFEEILNAFPGVDPKTLDVAIECLLKEGTLGMGLTATAYRDLLKKHNTEKARADAAEAKPVEVKKERDSHWASRNEYVDHANTWRERYEKEKEKHERRTTMPKQMNKNDKSEFTVEEAIDRLIGAMEAEERSGVKLKIIPKLNAVLDACLDLITATRRMVSGKGE